MLFVKAFYNSAAFIISRMREKHASDVSFTRQKTKA
jgi:hypothetical protein